MSDRLIPAVFVCCILGGIGMMAYGVHRLVEWDGDQDAVRNDRLRQKYTQEAQVCLERGGVPSYQLDQYGLDRMASCAFPPAITMEREQ